MFNQSKNKNECLGNKAKLGIFQMPELSLVRLPEVTTTKENRDKVPRARPFCSPPSSLFLSFFGWNF